MIVVYCHYLLGLQSKSVVGTAKGNGHGGPRRPNQVVVPLRTRRTASRRPLYELVLVLNGVLKPTG